MNLLPYFLNLAVMLLLVAALAVGSLWLWRRLQPGLGFSQRQQSIRIVDAVPMGATGRLAVVEFADKRLLIAVSRSGIQLLSEAPVPTFVMPDDDQ